MSLVRNIKNIQRWTFCRSAYTSISLSRLMSSSTPVPANPPDTPKAPSNTNSIPGVGNRASYKPDNLEKKFLVWTGKYKSIEEIPEYIYQETMERTRNQIRIKGANIMMILTVLGCIAMVYSGKKAAKSGESVEKYNLDWHKKYNDGNAKPTS